MNVHMHLLKKTSGQLRFLGLSKCLLIVVTTLLLSACDLLGLGPDPRILLKEAESKAIGAACRQGLRSIEDCYVLNKGMNRAAIYAGWLEMDAYMRDNKIEGVKSEIAPPTPAQAPVATPAEEVVTDANTKPKAAGR